ncbi:MAG: HDOD domain-containing protein [Gammaproteobacteria bacterium]
MELELLLKDIKDIAPLPKAYIRIQELVNDPDSSLDELTAVISNDPGLTARILRIANSAYVGLPVKVDSIGRAVQILGLNQVHDLALASAAVGSLFKIQSKALDVYDFWRQSIYAAIVARVTARRCGIRNAERLFVAGLLHSIGNLLLAFREPPLYSELRDAAIRRQVPLADVQREHLGYDYAKASAELLRRWQLPDTVFQPIELHTQPIHLAPPALAHDVSMVHMGAAISRAAMWHSDADEPVPAFDTVAVSLTNLDEAAVAEIMGETDQAVVEAMTLLLPDLKKGLRKTAA